MCGNPFKSIGHAISGIFKNPIATIGDIAAVALGQPELLPLTQGGGTTINDLIHGKSLGASLGQGLEQGAETFAGQEAFGALTNAFPETTGSVNDALGTNFSTGGNSLTDLLGQTSGQGSFDGVGTIGGDFSSGFSNALSAVGLGGNTAAGSTIATTDPLSFSGTESLSPGGSPSFDVGGGSSQFLQDTLGGGNSDISSFNNFVGSLDPAAAGGISPISTGTVSATPTTSSFSNFLSNPSLSTAGSVLKNNASSIIPAAGLALTALRGDQMPKGYNQLESQANELTGQGEQLQKYLSTGTLPEGAQAGLNQAAESAKASIRSQYASRGMSGSSAEQQDLANVDQQIQSQGFNMAMTLLQQGVNEQSLASGIYQNLMQTQLKQDEDLTQAITGFGTALAGGTPANTLQLKVA